MWKRSLGTSLPWKLMADRFESTRQWAWQPRAGPPTDMQRLLARSGRPPSRAETRGSLVVIGAAIAAAVFSGFVAGAQPVLLIVPVLLVVPVILWRRPH